MRAINLERIKSIIKRFPKSFATLSILTTTGLVLFATPRIKKFLARRCYKHLKPETDNRRTEYIYIKYHIYRESMRELKQKQEDEKKWISVIINPIGKWWKTAKHSVAWRLLKIAQTGAQAERLKAVQQLVCMDHLKDWDFRHLAQICDARTAVSLARCGADVRWFVPTRMHGCVRNPKMLLVDLHNMLAQLLPNFCIEYFFTKYFPNQEPIEDILEFFTKEQVEEFPSEDTHLLKEVISFLQHITKNTTICEQIVDAGGLTHLMEMRKLFNDDNETLATLCKVLANISIVPDVVEHFFASGWIGVLAEWQQCQDLRLQVIAAKTMANLDHDDPNHSIYPPNVYPLHPRVRTRHKPKADIVFVHGLMGGVFNTWRQRTRRHPPELGLYGKNAFYTSETDDVFLISAEQRSSNENRNEPPSGKKMKRIDYQDISDANTKEFVEIRQNEPELDSDWEVVYPDIPISASDSNCHGFCSIPGNKWRNEACNPEYTKCWPMDWLPDDYPDARIIGIDYTSAVSQWSQNFTKYCPCEQNQGHIDVRGRTLLQRISTADVGNNRPVVWIGHSMGGLLTKLMLLDSLDNANPKVQQIARNTSGIVFLGTPHRGSPIAKLKQYTQLIFSPSMEVKEMEENAPKLLDMHRRFMACLNTRLPHICVCSIAEGSPTKLTSFKFPLHIVTEESSRIDFGEFYLMQDDHLSLSKPLCRESFIYQRLLDVIREAIHERHKVEKQNNLENHQSAHLKEQLEFEDLLMYLNAV